MEWSPGQVSNLNCAGYALSLSLSFSFCSTPALYRGVLVLLGEEVLEDLRRLVLVGDLQ
jgi:hypothetical protein